jgi:hypothetical protein
MNMGWSVKEGFSVKLDLLKLANRSVIESLFVVVSSAASDCVACDAGESVVMVMLLYCRFRWRGK